MLLFLETIKLINGVVQFPEWHNNRIIATFKNFGYKYPAHNLLNYISVPEEYKSGVVKCRMDYNEKEYRLNFTQYAIKNIQSLKLVQSNDINYAFKFCDRSKLNVLLRLKEDCDDILIVKNGKITETSFSNVCLFNGKNWITPDEPLLNGTCRQRMLLDNRIEEKPVYVDDLYKYEKIVLINALRGDRFENPIPVASIK